MAVYLRLLAAEDRHLRITVSNAVYTYRVERLRLDEVQTLMRAVQSSQRGVEVSILCAAASNLCAVTYKGAIQGTPVAETLRTADMTLGELTNGHASHLFLRPLPRH